MKKLKTDSKKILLIGVGNSGRGDDGLGWKFTDLIGQNEDHGIDIEYRYQLQIEDTELINNYDLVIFADASKTSYQDGFEFRPCVAANHYFFSSHLQSPETILYLANNLYDKHPEAYTVAISGYDWELKPSLSIEAEQNLQSALTFFIKEFLATIQQSVHADKNRLGVS